MTAERKKPPMLSSSDGIPRAIHGEKSHALAVELPAELARYTQNARRWREHCDVTVLRDGAQTYPAMLAAIAAARVSICLEVYILTPDAMGDRFKAALIERAKAGVAVRVMYDAVGSLTLADGWLDGLRAVGGEVLIFNSIRPWRRRYNLSLRDHRKILVVDDAVAFTGGLNIALDYASTSVGGAGWHDMHCMVRGGIVLDLARLFRRTWMNAGGSLYPSPPRAEAGPTTASSAIVRMIENTGRRRGAIRGAYIHVIKAAQTQVLIQNAYFLPERVLRRALARAVNRGVEVRIIVPGHSDVRLVEWAMLYAMRRLAQRGVTIMRWRGPMMHAKTAVVDGVWSTIGSYNFDSQSRFNNLEVTLEILDRAVGAQLVAEFDGDLANCDPYDEAAWRRLPWWRKAFAWLGYRLRRFL